MSYCLRFVVGAVLDYFRIDVIVSVLIKYKYLVIIIRL